MSISRRLSLGRTKTHGAPPLFLPLQSGSGDCHFAPEHGFRFFFQLPVRSDNRRFRIEVGEIKEEHHVIYRQPKHNRPEDQPREIDIKQQVCLFRVEMLHAIFLDREVDPRVGYVLVVDADSHASASFRRAPEAERRSGIRVRGRSDNRRFRIEVPSWSA
jgi:hypothetical protein